MPDRLPPDVIARHGLTPEEYSDIERRIGRAPNLVELGVFSVMWSEHCAYKSSRAHFHLLPTTGPHVVLGPGENAGVVDIGPDASGRRWGAAFKMESHNHPSFIEPYQGAATGVGGILRDVFTMGARPIAILDALRFGNPKLSKTRQLVPGVVHGIGGYGNCMGVPTVGGNCGFDDGYDGNILVNAFALGTVPLDRIFLGKAEGIGNPVLYIGSATGRDGIHGATMASAVFDDETEQKRPTVQVGDPFTEKLLLEACLEIFAHDWLVGVQDMGAAGLTSSSFEMASRAGAGLEIDLSAVPVRAAGMTSYELMLSESQERMLMVARQGHEADVLAVCRKWGLEGAIIGTVTDSGRYVARFQGDVVIDLPIAAVVDDCPRYDRPRQRPADLDARGVLDLEGVEDDPRRHAPDLTSLLAHPDVASKRWIWQQFDHTVRVGTVVQPGLADAAVVRVVENGALLALAVDCPERYGYADPHACGAYAVAEAVRNIACVGAEPLGLTDCLNFGNPQDPEVMWGIVEAMRGLGDAARELGCPVVSGNVSLYNTTTREDGREHSILPTPMVAAVGRLPDGTEPVRAGFVDTGDEVWLLGRFAPSLGASLWLREYLGHHQGRPSPVDFAAERAVTTLVRRLIAERIARNAHDLSDGGLAVALAECALHAHGGARGVQCRLPTPAEALGTNLKVERLFGETGASVLVGIQAGDAQRLLDLAHAGGVPALLLGVVGELGGPFELGPLACEIEGLAHAFAHGFETALGLDSDAGLKGQA
jgi:phosphoribosylformylglycinamidine synthase II